MTTKKFDFSKTLIHHLDHTEKLQEYLESDILMNIKNMILPIIIF